MAFSSCIPLGQEEELREGPSNARDLDLISHMSEIGLDTYQKVMFDISGASKSNAYTWGKLKYGRVKAKANDQLSMAIASR